MKNKLRMIEVIRSIAIVALAVLVGFAFLSCKEEEEEEEEKLVDTSGRLTITGLSSKVGSYIGAQCTSQDAPEDAPPIFMFWAAESISGSGTKNLSFTRGTISGDSVTLKVWRVDRDDNNISVLSEL